MPRGDTGRTFLPLLASTCELQLVPPSGVLYQAHGASAEKGKRLAEYIAAEIRKILKAEFPDLAPE